MSSGIERLKNFRKEEREGGSISAGQIERWIAHGLFIGGREWASVLKCV